DAPGAMAPEVPVLDTISALSALLLSQHELSVSAYASCAVGGISVMIPVSLITSMARNSHPAADPNRNVHVLRKSQLCVHTHPLASQIRPDVKHAHALRAAMKAAQHFTWTVYSTSHALELSKKLRMTTLSSSRSAAAATAAVIAAWRNETGQS